MNIAHHITLTGCEYLPQINKSITIGNTWQCKYNGFRIFIDYNVISHTKNFK